MDNEEYCEAWQGYNHTTETNCGIFKSIGNSYFCCYCGKKLKWSDEDEVE